MGTTLGLSTFSGVPGMLGARATLPSRASPISMLCFSGVVLLAGANCVGALGPLSSPRRLNPWPARGRPTWSDYMSA